MTLEGLLKKYKQHEIDFLLPKSNGDNHLYLDLFFLYSSPEQRWQEVHALIHQYLNFCLKKYKDKKMNEGELLAKLHFPEVPYVALGHCKKGIYGRGTGDDRAYVFKDYIFDNEEVKKVGIEALAKLSISIGGIGPDLLSDMVANFAMLRLLEYTNEQVSIYGLETREFQISRILKVKNLEWEALPKVKLPFFKKTGEPRVLVPRHLVKRLPLLTTTGFYDNYLKYVLQEEEQDRLNTIRIIGQKPKVDKVTLDEIEKKLLAVYESLGEATREKTLQKPSLIDDYLADPLVFKRKHVKKPKEKIDWAAYIKELQAVGYGKENARIYAEVLRKIFTALYKGDFVNGSLEEQSVDGLYFYDVIFGNSADTAFFRFLRNQQIKAGAVICEAKNYDKTKVSNSQFNQANGYTISGARELVFLISRKESDDKSIERAKRHFLSHKVLLLPIYDEDVIDMLKVRDKDLDSFDTLLVERAKIIMGA